MNKIEEVLLKFYPDIKDCELDEPIRTCASELNDLLLEFGKQCFEAGFEAGTDCEFNGGFSRLEFKDYLKSLENE